MFHLTRRVITSPERRQRGQGVGWKSRLSECADRSVLAISGAKCSTALVTHVHRVENTRVAEAVKITESAFRSVNIAFVNELKLIYARMGINIWDVIEAAKTKPFGFMPFYPGPGLGGHCIPIDPFYLSWKAKEFDIPTRFVEIAGEINAAMPYRVVDLVANGLGKAARKILSGANLLLVGLAYKKNIDDLRESPALKIWDILKNRGATVSYYDPYIPAVPKTREYSHDAGTKSIAWRRASVSEFDAAIIVTDHDLVDYAELADWTPLVFDTRNATRSVPPELKVKIIHV
jgi:UDP-N-acetyl-D-glucosamine dehydrogenase